MLIVIKVGTSSICREGTMHPQLSLLSGLVETVMGLRAQGHGVILVSSGAIGMGRRHLGGRFLDPNEGRHQLSIQQALAAVGQSRLMAMYAELFGLVGQPIAQVLLTRHDIADVLTRKETFRELLQMGVVPVVNENDTVSVAEIRFGDNDSLSAITAAMTHADWLFLLTDVECLYAENPRVDPNAKPIYTVAAEEMQDLLQTVRVSSPGTSMGTGGMITKVVAARLATAAGVSTVIQSSQCPQRILDILQRHPRSKQSAPPPTPTFKYTYFAPQSTPLGDRKRWLTHGLTARGTLLVDAGAYEALTRPDFSASLFAAGIVGVEGDFQNQEAVKIVHRKGVTNTGTSFASNATTEDLDLGRGIVNYSAAEIQRIRGCQSHEIQSILGYSDAECVIHRDNLVLFTKK